MASAMPDDDPRIAPDMDADTAPAADDPDVDAKLDELLAKKRAKATPPGDKAPPAAAAPTPPVDPSAETPTKRNVETVVVPTIDASAFYNRRMAARARE